MADVPVITQQKWVAFCSPVLNEKLTFKPLCGITLTPAANHCGDLLTLPYLDYSCSSLWVNGMLGQARTEAHDSSPPNV